MRQQFGPGQRNNLGMYLKTFFWFFEVFFWHKIGRLLTGHCVFHIHNIFIIPYLARGLGARQPHKSRQNPP